MKTIYFVRHCQSDNTVHEDRVRPLTEKGMRDAMRVTEYFREIRVDRVVSSPYKRAMDTVSGVAHAHGLPVDTDDDLRERAVGGWVEDFDAFAGAQWADMDHALPGGESLNTVIMRSKNALKRLLNDPSDTTVVGTHGTALCALLHALDDGFGYADFQRIVGIMPWIVRCTFDGDRLIAREETIFE